MAKLIIFNIKIVFYIKIIKNKETYLIIFYNELKIIIDHVNSNWNQSKIIHNDLVNILFSQGYDKNVIYAKKKV